MAVSSDFETCKAETPRYALSDLFTLQRRDNDVSSSQDYEANGELVTSPVVLQKPFERDYSKLKVSQTRNCTSF